MPGSSAGTMTFMRSVGAARRCSLPVRVREPEAQDVQRNLASWHAAAVSWRGCCSLSINKVLKRCGGMVISGAVGQ